MLYKSALRLLLEEWAAEKRIMRQAIYEGLSVELEEVLLSEIAYEGFEADRLFIPQSQLVERIKEFLSSNLNAPKHLSGEQVLDAIAIQQGILVERVEDVYSFSHLTLQEYLTARYIYAHGQIPQMVEKYLTDERWREIILLTSGLMVDRGSDELLLEMHKAAKKYARHPKVKALLQWADLVTAGSSGDLKPATKRAEVIVIASVIARPRVIDISIIRDITSGIAFYLVTDIDISICHASDSNIDFTITIAINSVRRLEKLGVFTELKCSQFTNQLQDLQSAVKGLDITQIKNIDEQVRSAYIEAFKLTQELITYNDEESQALSKYLYSFDLLLKCKQEAARLSPATWDAIEAELLLPPDD